MHLQEEHKYLVIRWAVSLQTSKRSLLSMCGYPYDPYPNVFVIHSLNPVTTAIINHCNEMTYVGPASRVSRRQIQQTPGGCAENGFSLTTQEQPDTLKKYI